MPLSQGRSLIRTPLVLCQRVRLKGVSEVLCACCRSPIDRHQPDPDKPERLLGTCPDCGTWHLIDEAGGVLYVVPDLWSVQEPDRN